MSLNSFHLKQFYRMRVYTFWHRVSVECQKIADINERTEDKYAQCILQSDKKARNLTPKPFNAKKFWYDSRKFDTRVGTIFSPSPFFMRFLHFDTDMMSKYERTLTIHPTWKCSRPLWTWQFCPGPCRVLKAAGCRLQRDIPNTKSTNSFIRTLTCLYLF